MLPKELQCKFQNWLKGFEELGALKIQRCYFPDRSWKDLTGLEIHAFGDASEKGYGVCVYLRVPLEDGCFKVSFVVGRGKASPIKRVSLPRLELLGALLFARLIECVRSALRLPKDVSLFC